MPHHHHPTRRGLLTALLPYTLLAQREPRRLPPDQAERFRKMSEDFERQGLAEPFKGITAGGNVVPGLFPIQSSGVSTAPVRNAAEAFLASLTNVQRIRT